MSKTKNLTLEILTQKEELRRIDPKGQILVPIQQRKEVGLEPGDNYISISVLIKSEDPKYNGARGILMFPINFTYTPKEYSSKHK